MQTRTLCRSRIPGHVPWPQICRAGQPCGCPCSVPAQLPGATTAESLGEVLGFGLGMCSVSSSTLPAARLPSPFPAPTTQAQVLRLAHTSTSRLLFSGCTRSCEHPRRLHPDGPDGPDRDDLRSRAAVRASMRLPGSESASGVCKSREHHGNRAISLYGRTSTLRTPRDLPLSNNLRVRVDLSPRMLLAESLVADCSAAVRVTGRARPQGQAGKSSCSNGGLHAGLVPLGRVSCGHHPRCSVQQSDSLGQALRPDKDSVVPAFWQRFALAHWLREKGGGWGCQRGAAASRAPTTSLGR